MLTNEPCLIHFFALLWIIFKYRNIAITVLQEFIDKVSIDEHLVYVQVQSEGLDILHQVINTALELNLQGNIFFRHIITILLDAAEIFIEITYGLTKQVVDYLCDLLKVILRNINEG